VAWPGLPLPAPLSHTRCTVSELLPYASFMSSPVGVRVVGLVVRPPALRSGPSCEQLPVGESSYRTAQELYVLQMAGIGLTLSNK